MTKQRRHQEKRKAAGLCINEGCDTPPEGKTRCLYHRAAYAEAMKRYRRRKKEAISVDA